MKVVVTDYIENDLDWEKEQATRLGIDFEAHQLKFAPVDELAAATEDADVIVVNMASITPMLIERWRRCKLLIRHGIGYDNVDVDAVTAQGIRFVNCPDYCVEEVAEHAIALVLALGRKLWQSHEVLMDSIRKGQWDFRPIEPLHRLKGQTLGIVGFGRIGSRVYEKLLAFGFDFLVCDPYLGEKRREAIAHLMVPLEELLGRADMVTLHAPFNDETSNMINQQTLALMKPTASLVNTARAGLVDQDAVVNAIRNGRLHGCALDVFRTEPPRPDDPLLALDNVILTPHMSWCSVEAGFEIRRQIMDQIARHAGGLEPYNWVNRDMLQFQELHQ